MIQPQIYHNETDSIKFVHETFLPFVQRIPENLMGKSVNINMTEIVGFLRQIKRINEEHESTMMSIKNRLKTKS